MINITKVEPNTIDPEALAFGPTECIKCYFDGSIPVEYFLVTPDIETYEDFVEVTKLVKEQLGCESFSQMYCNLGTVIVISRCPQCGSKDILEDF